MDHGGDITGEVAGDEGFSRTKGRMKVAFLPSSAYLWPMRTPSFIPPIKRGEAPSKFDRHYGTRQAKRWRDVLAIMLGFCLLVVAVLLVDPLFSRKSLRLGPLLVVVALCTILFVLALSFHLRYRSRE